MNVADSAARIHEDRRQDAWRFLLPLLGKGTIMGMVEDLHGPDRLPIPIARVVLEGRTADGHTADFFIVLCPFCGQQHEHSGAPGHRVADCSAMPRFNRGYYVLECLPAERLAGRRA
jgi:hypothetical protein